MSTRLGEIEARLAKANPNGSEWTALTDPGDRKTAPAWIVDADDLEIRMDCTYASGKVAHFVAAAPADVAYLLAELRAARTTNERLNRRAQVAESALNAVTSEGRAGIREDKLLREYWQRAEDARAQVREARAGALEDAAVVIDEDQYDCYDPYYAEWLRARAAAERGVE